MDNEKRLKLRNELLDSFSKLINEEPSNEDLFDIYRELETMFSEDPIILPLKILVDKNIEPGIVYFWGSTLKIVDPNNTKLGARLVNLGQPNPHPSLDKEKLDDNKADLIEYTKEAIYNIVKRLKTKS